MDELLKIRYRHGEMTIILENFFPSSQKDLKKLLKVIELDWDHEDELIEQATTWISEHIQMYEQMEKECANRYVDIRPRAIEFGEKVQGMESYLDSIAAWKKTPKYKKLKERFKESNAEYRRLKNDERSYHSDFTKYHRKKEGLQKNLKFLTEGKWLDGGVIQGLHHNQKQRSCGKV